MKNIKFVLLIMGIFILGINGVSANTLKNLDIDIYIDKNGTANITEVWDMNVDKGTENYKPMTIDNRNLTDFVVKDETGKVYDYMDSWNINASLSSKAQKNGINYTSSGIELCWGMGSYGDHIYTISYKISDSVTEYNDSQAMVLKLVNDNLNPAPNKVKITISSYFYFEDTLAIWGYGFKGYNYVKNGKISMETVNGLSSSQYMTVLAKFNLNSFSVKNKENKPFSAVLEETQQGKFNYDYSDNFEKKASQIAFIVEITFFLVVVCLISVFIPLVSNSNKKFVFGLRGKKINKKEINYYREIPCNKDIFRAYWVADTYSLNKNKTSFLGTILLKWLNENKIEIKKIEEKKLLGGTKSQFVIDLSKPFTSDNYLEVDLYYMIKEASSDGMLENKEMEIWCRTNYTKIFNWFEKVLSFETMKLVEEGKVTRVTTKKLGIFTSSFYKVDDSMKDEANAMEGLKKFLNDFTLIREREAIEIVNWQEYLMYAQIFGIADKVAKQFKQFYPDVITDLNYDTILMVNTISYSAGRSATSARSNAESYHSGGGGFSSGGGGGGSFGGGSGGGCR